MFKRLTLLAMFAASVSFSATSLPAGSWEAWIQSAVRGEAPPRPDGLALMSPLPAWVDCHLSWRVDQSNLHKNPLKIAPEIILRASPKICDGQLEQWAH